MRVRVRVDVDNVRERVSQKMKQKPLPPGVNNGTCDAGHQADISPQRVHCAIAPPAQQAVA